MCAFGLVQVTVGTKLVIRICLNESDFDNVVIIVLYVRWIGLYGVYDQTGGGLIQVCCNNNVIITLCSIMWIKHLYL